MKTLKIVIFSLGIIIFFSCNDGNKNTKDDSGSEINVVPEKEIVKDDSDGVLKTQDMTSMYSKLNMTDEQIELFENDYKQKLNARTSDNIEDPNLVDLQMDESLKNILTPQQYENYQEWRKSNPNE